MKRQSVSKIFCIILCAVLLLSLTGCKSGAVKNAEKLIAAIGEVTAESKDAVEAAEAAYAALSDQDKAQVEGAETLTAARTALDSALRIRTAADLIDALGEEITVESAGAVEAAEAAVEALSAEEKALLLNAGTLTAAREKLDQAVKEARLRELIGAWNAEVDGTEAICEELAGEMEMDKDALLEQAGTFLFQCILELREDGTYALRLDADSFRSGMSGLVANLKPVLRQEVVKTIGQQLASAGFSGDLSTEEAVEKALGDSLDNIMKASAGMTLDELIDATFDELIDNMDMEELSADQEGNYLANLDENVLYFSEKLNDEPDTDNGERFRLEDGTLEIFDHTGKGFFEGLYPITFTKQG